MQYRERIIFLGKAIDEETGNQLVATMLYLDSENKKDLNLYINCSGGDVSVLYAFFNSIAHSLLALLHLLSSMHCCHWHADTLCVN